MRYIAILFLILFSICKSCSAISSADNDLIKEAQYYGQKQSTSQYSTFVLPWTSYEETSQKLDERAEYAYIYTPFLLVAADARDRKLSDQDINLVHSKKVLDEYSGYLTFSVTLFGTEETFGDKIKCMLRTNSSIIKPQHSTSSVTQKTHWFPQKPTFTTTQYYYFLQDQVVITKPVTLIIITTDNKEHRFNFDLFTIK